MVSHAVSVVTDEGFHAMPDLVSGRLVLGKGNTTGVWCETRLLGIPVKHACM